MPEGTQSNTILNVFKIIFSLETFFRHYPAQIHEFSLKQRYGRKLNHRQSIKFPAQRIKDQTFQNYYHKINATYRRHWPFMPFS